MDFITKGGENMEQTYYTVDDVMKILGIKPSKAYGVIRACNKELDMKGYMTIKGKVSKKYFEERFYGICSSKEGA